MKRFFLVIALLIATLGVVVGDAEAKRLGGGKSFGMQRESVSRQAPPPSAPAPAHNTASPTPAQPAPAPVPPQSQGSRWLGPLAGLAAGIGLGALFAHFGGGFGGAAFTGLLMLVALFAVVVLALRLFARSPALQTQTAGYPAGNAYEPAPAANLPATPGNPVNTAGATTTAAIPADFDVDGFLRVAKLNFIRLQAANDTGNLDDLREFLTPEMFAEVRLQLSERGAVSQTTDVVQLNAALLEVVEDGARHIVSVRFSGLLREDSQAPAAPFDEVWHLSKPTDGSHGWLVAGIQQVG